MAAIVLDTTVVIDLLRRREGALERLNAVRGAGDRPYLCAITIEEVVRGLRDDETSGTQRLFTGLRVQPLGEAEGWLAGEWRRIFARRGVTLTQADCLIAAAAVSLGARLATGNPKDFPMPELSTEHWPVGE
jgi:predicted nucleic acid-binding protein